MSDFLLLHLLILSLIGRALSQICYNCIYVQATSSDPSIQTALLELSSRYPQYSQCATFPNLQTNAAPTVNCQTLNYTIYPGFGLGGLPFNGWMCGKQSYTVTIKNYENGIAIAAPVTVRGCVPIQNYNPYNQWGCWDMVAQNTNPYIQTITTGLFWPQLNVGMQYGTLTGQYCQCGWNNCNSATSNNKLVLSIASALITATLTLLMTSHQRS